MGLLRLLGIEKYLKKVKDYVDEKVGSIKPSIDGVNMTALKYICKPYELDIYVDNQTLPEDLRAIIWDEENDGFHHLAAKTIYMRDSDYTYPITRVELSSLISGAGRLEYNGNTFEYHEL